MRTIGVACLLSLLAAAVQSYERAHVPYSPLRLLGDGATSNASETAPVASVPIHQLSPASPSNGFASPWHPCNASTPVSSPADLFYCTSAGDVKLTDCSAIDKSTIIAAPFLSTVASFSLGCSVWALYLPRLETVTGVAPHSAISFHLDAAVIKYVYLFSLHSMPGRFVVSTDDLPAIFEAPYLYSSAPVFLEFGAVAFSSSANSTKSGANYTDPDPDLCGPDKTLDSPQVIALQQPCDVGAIHWNSLEADPTLLSGVAVSCQATSIRSATFLNVPAHAFVQFSCLDVAYIGDKESSSTDSPPALTIQNSMFPAQFDVLSLYGGVYLVASIIQLVIGSPVVLHGIRYYLEPPPTKEWIILVPRVNVSDPKSITMQNCTLRTAGQFVEFSDESLDCPSSSWQKRPG